ncbi:MAG: TolC family outer membrane protein [Alphaproteobacteria bacterium]
MFAVSAVAAGGPAGAETLRQALASAYNSNPELQAQRANLRAVDEGVPLALSGYRPTISSSADYGIKRFEADTATASGGTVNSVSNTHPRGYSISVVQPLFDGFKTRNRTAQADAQVYSGREFLLNTEQNVLLQAATAFVDVRRDGAIVRLNNSNLKVLREDLKSTRARFEVGELTRTDVAQSEASVSRAVSEFSQAKANLSSSKAAFRQTVGHAPGSLSRTPSMVAKLPRSLKKALDIARTEHPAVLSALYNVDASDFEINAIEGEFLPSVSLEGSYTRRWESSAATRDSNTGLLLGRLTIPLYQAGSVSARVRQARQTSEQRRLDVLSVRNQVRAAATVAWDGLVAARAQIVSDNQQVRAARIALDGVRQEAEVGQRTTQDTLDAQQDLLNAQVSREISTRNEVVATFSLISAVGRLSARELNLAVEIYDPENHYQKVRDKWWGTTIE